MRSKLNPEPPDLSKALRLDLRDILVSFRSVPDSLRLPCEVMDRQDLVVRLRPLNTKICELMGPLVTDCVQKLFDSFKSHEELKPVPELVVLCNEITGAISAFTTCALMPLSGEIPGIPEVGIAAITIDKEKRIARIENRARALALKLEELIQVTFGDNKC